MGKEKELKNTAQAIEKTFPDLVSCIDQGIVNYNAGVKRGEKISLSSHYRDRIIVKMRDQLGVTGSAAYNGITPEKKGAFAERLKNAIPVFWGESSNPGRKIKSVVGMGSSHTISDTEAGLLAEYVLVPTEDQMKSEEIVEEALQEFNKHSPIIFEGSDKEYKIEGNLAQKVLKVLSPEVAKIGENMEVNRVGIKNSVKEVLSKGIRQKSLTKDTQITISKLDLKSHALVEMKKYPRKSAAPKTIVGRGLKNIARRAGDAFRIT